MTRFPTADVTADDDPGFVACVDRIIAGLVFRYRPELVCVVRIRRWFDHRWLGFSGKGRVAFDAPDPSHPGVTLEELRLEKLTFPPFAPTRVASEQHWQRTPEGDYARTEGRFRVHPPTRQHSSTNLQRRVLDRTDAGLFVWSSSTSRVDRRGSLLVHVVNERSAIPWFASLLAGDERWTVGELDGLGRVEVEELLEHPPGVR